MLGNMYLPEMIGAILLILIGVAITVLIAMQTPKNDGMSSLAGAGAFGGGGKDRSIDAKVNRLVKILCIAFMVVVAAVYALNIYL